jgi:hypothetical protein
LYNAYFKYKCFFSLDAVNWAACGRLMDYSTFNTIIVIGCGSDNPTVQLWDVHKNEFFTTDFSCPSTEGSELGAGHFDELNESHLVYTNNGLEIYTFNLEDGFVFVGDTPGDTNFGDAFVAPRGYTGCIAEAEAQ